MNCREANRILDTSPSGALDGRQKQAAEQHIHTCSQCREAWHAYRETAALRIPPVPPELRQRVRSLLTSSAPVNKSARRYWLVGAALAVGAAVAATVAFQIGGSEQQAAVGFDATLFKEPAADNQGKSGHARTTQPSNGVPMPTASSQEVGEREISRAEPSLDPNSVVVVLNTDGILEPETAGLFQLFYDELLAQLSAIPGLNVASPEQVNGFLRLGTAEEVIASQLGAGRLILLTASADPKPSLSGILANVMLDRSTGELAFFGYESNRWPEQIPDDIADLVNMFEEARAHHQAADRSADLAETQAIILNAGLAPGERVAALGRLPPDGQAHTDAVVIAAVELATIAPRHRGYIWLAIHGIENPYLIDPLLDSLNYDEREHVRVQAAAALATFVSESSVNAALVQAQRNDPSDAVRDSARKAMMSEDEIHDAALAQLLDSTLPAKERLQATNFILNGRIARSMPMNHEAAQAVFNIGASSSDPDVRSSAWATLGRAEVEDPEFKDILLEDLRDHPDDKVRWAAALALSPYADDPIIRSALEGAQSDAAYRVRSMARSALKETAD